MFDGMSMSWETRGGVTVVAVRGPVDEAAVAEYLAVLDRHLDSHAPFVMVIDGSELSDTPSNAEGPEWDRDRVSRIAAVHRGVAFVTGPEMSDERVVTLGRLQPPGIPYAFVADVEEALRWAQRYLDDVPAATLGQRVTEPLMSAREG